MTCENPHDLLDRTSPQLEIGFFGIPGHMRGEHDVLERQKIGRNVGFILEDIDSSPRNLTADETSSQRSTVD